MHVREGTSRARASLSLEIVPKLLELLRDVLAESARPGARVAVLLNSREPTHRLQWENASDAAKALQLELVRVDVSGPGGLAAALDSLPATGARGVFVFTDDPIMIENRVRISEAAIRYKLPMIAGPRVFATAGALITYGMDMTEEFRQSAAYVVKVSNGSRGRRHRIAAPRSAQRASDLCLMALVERQADEACQPMACLGR